MADQTTDTRQDPQVQQHTQQSYGEQDFSQSQAGIDRMFKSQIDSIGTESVRDLVQAYFDQVELSVKTSRRVSETWAQTMILRQTQQQIVAEASERAAHQAEQRVLARLRQDPALARELLKS